MKKLIYEEDVNYYIDPFETLHIFVQGKSVADISGVSEEEADSLIDEALAQLGYEYKEI